MARAGFWIALRRTKAARVRGRVRVVNALPAGLLVHANDKFPELSSLVLLYDGLDS